MRSHGPAMKDMKPVVQPRLCALSQECGQVSLCAADECPVAPPATLTMPMLMSQSYSTEALPPTRVARAMPCK